MTDLLSTTISDSAIESFISGHSAEEDEENRKRIGNMYTTGSYGHFITRITFTTDSAGTAELSFDITHAYWYPYKNDNTQVLIYGNDGITYHYVRAGETYSLADAFKFAITTDAEALISCTESISADPQSDVNAALDTTGYVIRNQPIKIISAEGRAENNGDVVTAAQAKYIASFTGSCEVQLQPNTTYYLWLYSTFDQTFWFRPFMFTGFGHHGQVIVRSERPLGAYWAPADMYVYANDKWNKV